jgi:polyhydroxybutyrate depolymerase
MSFGKRRAPRMGCFFFLAALFAIIVIAASIWHAGRQDRPDLVIETKDGPRAAILRRVGTGPRPTVILLHGASDSAKGAAKSYGFVEAATKAGFNLVVPDGLQGHWHDERTGGLGGPDDVAFLNTLTARLIAQGIAAPGHVYLAGFSNGGSMSFTMACRAGRLYRGVGAIGANMPVGLEPCHPPPMVLVMVSGTADRFMPYNGGKVGWLSGGGAFWSAQHTAEFFAENNGDGPSDARALPHQGPADGTSVTDIRWPGDVQHPPVTLYRVNGGGHQVPGGPDLPQLLFGARTHDISAADEILAAFKKAEAYGAVVDQPL